MYTFSDKKVKKVGKTDNSDFSAEHDTDKT